VLQVFSIISSLETQKAQEVKRGIIFRFNVFKYPQKIRKIMVEVCLELDFIFNYTNFYQYKMVKNSEKHYDRLSEPRTQL